LTFLCSSCALGVLAAAFAAAYPTAATAQGPDGNRVVRGVVRDSLNGGAGIRGATVRIAALGLQALTDQRARSECRSLSPERHELSVHTALLDSLGIDTLWSTVDVASRRNADVVSATPPRIRYAALVCGGSLPSDIGIVRGKLSPALARLALATTAGAPP